MEHLLGRRRLRQNIRPRPSGIELLPFDIQLNILSYLRLPDIGKLKLTNRFYHELTKRDTKLICSALAARILPEVRELVPRNKVCAKWFNCHWRDTHCDSTDCLLLMGALLRTLKSSDENPALNRERSYGARHRLIGQWERIKTSDIAWVKVLHRVTDYLEEILDGFSKRQLPERYGIDFLVWRTKRECLTVLGLGEMCENYCLRDYECFGHIKHGKDLHKKACQLASHIGNPSK